MHDFTPWTSLLGGALIGLGSAGIMLVNRRIAGVSSIVGALFTWPPASTRLAGDGAWRVLFALGLVLGGVIGVLSSPSKLSMAGTLSLPWLVASGLLVGFGTRLGNGCTSGHGVCGISRFSKRSIAATLTFMLVAAVAVFVLRHVLHVSAAEAH